MVCSERRSDSGGGGPGGWRILPEPEMHLGKHVLVPDLAGWRHPRLERLPDTAYIAVSPDWICEIVSPLTVRLDRSKKLATYARERVGHAWLLDPIARTLEVLRLEAGRWTILGAHENDDVVRAEPFEKFELRASVPLGGLTSGPDAILRFRLRGPFPDVPEWRNWQTRGTQNPVGFTPRVGSIPSSGTMSSTR